MTNGIGREKSWRGPVIAMSLFGAALVGAAVAFVAFLA